MTSKQEERMREMYRKCLLELILLPDEALQEGFPKLFLPPKASPEKPPPVPLNSDTQNPSP